MNSNSNNEFDIQLLQRKNIEFLLQLNGQNDDDDIQSSVWKIIIFDTFCQDVLSPLFKVGKLRDHNITLHLNISKPRDKLHGVKSIYFLQPTEENLKLIQDDISKDLYDCIFFNFSYNVDDQMLGKLAQHVSKYNQLYKVQQVFQHNLNFISLSSNLFDLKLRGIYHKVQKNQDLDHYSQYIANSLFSVIRTLKTIPCIYFNDKNKFNQAIVANLKSLIQTFIQENNEEYKQQSQRSQDDSCLILFNRNIDLSSAMLHPWHYKSLIHDLCGINNNKVEMQNEVTSFKKVEYDLDASTDKFWLEKQNVPFPYVADDIDKELNDWKTEYEKMGHKRQADNDKMSENLANALDQVPEMSERKRRIDLHTNIATHLMNEIKSRHLDQYFELGSSLITNKKLLNTEKQQFLQLITNPDNQEDSVRLLMIFFLSLDKFEQKDLDFIKQKITIQNPVLQKAVDYIKQLKNVKVEKAQDNLSEKDDDNNPLNLLKKVTSQVTNHGKGLLKNVQNYLPGQNNNYLVAKTTESILENKNAQLLENFSVYDPVTDQQKAIKMNRNHSNCIVFVSDGGQYNEYINLAELSAKINKNIIYGSSHLYSATELIKEFAQLN